MPLDTYANLQTAVLDWLARPGDPLVAPALPDLITVFEDAARTRLRTMGGETMTDLYATAGNGDLPLPDDFVELRAAKLSGYYSPLEFMSARETALPSQVNGIPQYYTIYGGGDYACADGGAMMRLTPPPDGPYTVNITYLRGLPALSTKAPTNWLLKASPSCYLFGTLCEASVYIGHDDRGLGWLQRRDAAFAALEQADLKARWGGPLRIRADMATP